MKPVKFHPDAAEEARAAAAHYEGIRAGLGVDYQAELAAALARIRDNPLLYAVESKTIRVCPLRRFPYLIFYEDLTDRVWVAAIGHQRRQPGYWSRRRPT
jgi:plasmid stabilization system protein ParE